MGEKKEREFPFELLQDFQVKFSLLTVQEEKETLLPTTASDNGEFQNLSLKEVVVEPCSLTLDEKILGNLGPKPKELGSDNIKPSQFIKVERFLKTAERVWGKKIAESAGYKLIRSAIDKKGLVSYWNAMKLVAFHSFKSRMIIKKSGKLIPIKTKRQFEFYFKSGIDPETLGKSDENFEGEASISAATLEASQPDTEICFDGAGEPEFDSFFKYVIQRICGKLDRQLRLKVKPPLRVWHQRFKSELIVFFKAKIGGNGYARDYIDTRIREMQRDTAELGGLSEVRLIRQSFMAAIDSDEFSHQEYTCLMAHSRGYGFAAISRFIGTPAKDVEAVIKKALPKAAELMYDTFCSQYQKPATMEGLTMTEKILRETLTQQPKRA